MNPESAFTKLTKCSGFFLWQKKLYERLLEDNIPAVCDIPTGLGKTNVIAIWLLALMNRPDKMPRRLVYVVNRRTVVDQTTNEVERLRENLPNLNHPEFRTLAISTLRGQFADNAEWSADPSKPAVICGTVDMIGSRLLFSGYRIGFRSRPLHAGFLGQDTLLVHDEAHLEPAFQKLIKTIQEEQQYERERTGDLPWPRLRVMGLSATSRDTQEDGLDPQAFLTLTDEERNPPRDIPDPPTRPIEHEWRRLKAAKHLHFPRIEDDKELSPKAVDLALAHKDSGPAVLVFVRRVEDALQIESKLKKELKKAKLPQHVVSLTGTMRGYERDALAKSDAVFARFMPRSDRSKETIPVDGTAYLVCTAAGEVGVNLSADHMVCDLSTFDSMAQRLGRVNRFGDRTDTRVDIIRPEQFGKKDKKGKSNIDKVDQRRESTLRLLKNLPGQNASPLTLMNIDAQERTAAFAPEPTIVPATDILFDAWALTTIRKAMPGRPPVAPYLHGLAEWEPPQTHVAWRAEVDIITGDLLKRYVPEHVLEDYPLKPHELLRDRSDRVFKQLEDLAGRYPEKGAWVVNDRDAVEVTTLEELADKQRKGRLNACTVVLPPSVGGLSSGLLDGSSEHADDVADISDTRVRVWSDDPDYDSKIREMRRVRVIELDPSEDDDEPRLWEWFESTPLEGGRSAKKPVGWETHIHDIVNHAKRIVADLSLPQEIANAVVLAAKLHDHGKRREQFQATLGNSGFPQIVLAKSGPKGARLPEPFRHEFASVLDADGDPALGNLTDDMKDLVLHLIAAHHGRARPHFGPDEALDPGGLHADGEALAIETPRRFARLQRRYGRWGLAYLESLLRAADWAASAAPSAYADEEEDAP